MRKYRGIFVIASIALVALLALSLVACSDSNSDNAPQPPTGLVVEGIDDFVYYANESAVILVAPKDKAIKSVVIPACVTEIEGNAFRSCTQLESVTFADNSVLNEVDAYAFNGCTALKSIALPDSVKTIGNHAFDGCAALESATYPTSVSAFGKEVFANCTKLKSISFPSSVATVTKKDLAGCSSLESLSFSAKNITIEDELYTGSTLKSVSFGGEANIGTRAFAGTSITKLTIPGGSTIGDSAFEGCALTSLTLKKGVKSIGANAFSGNKLTEISIPDSVESIGKNAFDGCKPTELTLAYLGTNKDSAAKIKDIFGNECAESLEKLTINGGKVMLGKTSVKEIIIDKAAQVQYMAFVSCTALEKLTVDCASFEQILYYSLEEGSDSVTIVISGNTLTESFLERIAATDIQFSQSNVTICRNAFYRSGWWDAQPDGAVYVSNTLYGYKGEIPQNTVLEVKDGTTTIPDYAISGCENIVGIKLPKSVTTIAEGAFKGGHIASVQIDSNNSKYIAVGSGIAEKSGGKLVYGTQGTILDGYEEKGGKKNYYVTSIGGHAFVGAQISDITIPSNIESIGKRAFYECSSLSGVTFASDSTLKAIGESAFEKCAIENITLPKSVTSLSGNVFVYNPLASISVEEGNTEFKISGGNLVKDKTIVTGIESGSIAEDIEVIGAYAYAGKSFNDGLVIPSGIKRIGDYAFYKSNIAGISFAEGSKLTSIGEHAFFGCLNMDSIAIPEGVVGVGEMAFYGCIVDTLYIPSTLKDVDATAFAVSANELTAPTQLLNTLLDEYSYLSESVRKITVIGNGKIGADTFANCDNLSEIVISQSVSDIEYGAFLSTRQFDIKVAEGNKNYYVKDNCLINRNTHELIWGNAGSVIPTDIAYDEHNNVIKDGDGKEQYEVMSIAPYAFKGVHFTSDFTIPSNVKAIQNNAFEEAVFDGALNMASSVSSIGDYAFQAAGFNGSFELPKDIDHIGQQVFYTTMFAEKVTIPSNVKSIGDGAFAGAVFGKGLEIKDGVETIGDSAFGGIVIYESFDVKTGTFVASKTLKIPASVRTIDDRAFLNAYGYLIKEQGLSSNMFGEYVALNEIVFEKGSKLEYIGTWAFAYNLNLQEVDFGGAKITYMASDALYATALIDTCYEQAQNNSVVYLGTIAIGYKADDEERLNVESITLKEGTTCIANDALGGLSNLKQVILPNSLTSICEGAFLYSNTIEEIVFQGTSEQWKAVKKHSGWDIGLHSCDEYVQCSECGSLIEFDNLNEKCEECLNKNE